MDHLTVALKIDARAAEMARGVEREARVICGNDPAQMAILLKALWPKIARMAAEIETRAALRGKDG